MALFDPALLSNDSDLSNLSEGEEKFIVSHMTYEECEQYEYIHSQVLRSTP